MLNLTFINLKENGGKLGQTMTNFPALVSTQNDTPKSRQYQQQKYEEKKSFSVEPTTTGGDLPLKSTLVEKFITQVSKFCIHAVSTESADNREDRS